MKFLNIVKSSLLLLLLVNLAYANFMQESEHTDSSCDNSCLQCQNTVYQMKFHKVADCQGQHCKSTCSKVKELWNNSPDGVFKPFEKDIFGKCEICFRAGFCTIGECKAQQDQELATIDQIVNKAKLTAKKTDYVEKLGFEQFHQDMLFYSPDKLTHIIKELKEAKIQVDNNLNASLATKNATGAIQEVKKVLEGLFDKQKVFTGTSVDALANEAITPEKEKENVKKYSEATAAYAKHVQKIVELKNEMKKNTTTSKDDQAKVDKLITEAKNDIENKLKENHKILKNSKDASKLPEIKHAIKTSIKEFEGLKTSLSQ